jgi:hypothetical protein
MVNPSKTETEVYEVSDPRLVAYLLCCNFKFVYPPHLKGTKVVFPFARSPEIKAEIENFENNDTSVGLKKFSTKLAHVKALMWHYRAVEDIPVSYHSDDERGGGDSIDR